MRKYSVIFLATLSLYGNPQDPHVQEGYVTFHRQKSATLHIATSDRAVINWKEFSIDKGERVHFLQPSGCSAVLNRVTGEIPSSIMGNLEANGAIYLLNPNGVIIGKDAIINTSSFFASTYDISDAAFMADGDLTFKGDSKAAVINYGTINSWDGDVALMGYTVENQGTLHVEKGTLALGAGQEILLKPAGSIFIHIRPSENKEGTGIKNSGLIEAVRAELKADGNAYQFAINHTGTIDAVSCCQINGEVHLVADQGNILVSGDISAPAREIRIIGDHIDIFDDATLDVSGEFGGGTILVGGDYQGKNPDIPNARMTHIDQDVTLKADALSIGDGGRVIVWSDEDTWMKGTIQSRGGSYGGNGGFVEISSKGHLDVSEKVDTTAVKGRTGQLLLDPCAVTIDSTVIDSGYSNVGCAAPCPIGNMCYSFSGATSNITPGALVTLLMTNDVCINASSGTAGTGSITFQPSPNGDVSWATLHTLTLIADSSASDQIMVLAKVQNMNAGFAPGTQVITVTTPNLHLGLDAATHTTPCALIATSGDVKVNNASFPTTIHITGGMMAGAQSGIVTGNGGNVTIGDALSPISGDIIMLGGTAPGPDNGANLLSAGGTLSITTSGNLTFDNSLQTAPILVATIGAGNIMITGTTGSTNLTIVGGTGTIDSLSVIQTFDSGNITIDINGDYLLQGGSSTASGFASIYGAFSMGTSNISLTGHNFSLMGGSAAGTDNSATIVTGMPMVGGGNGTISITASGAITLQGGNFSHTDVAIATLGPMPGNSIMIDAAGALQMTGGTIGTAAIFTNTMASPLTISNCASLSLTGGGIAAGTAIGTIGDNSTININVVGDTTLSSGVGGVAIGLGVGSKSVTMTGGGNCTLTSTGGISTIGAQGGGNVDLTFGGNFQMSGVMSTVTVAGGAGALTIAAGQNITLGDAVPGNASMITTVSGNITLVADNLFPYTSCPLFGTGSFSKTTNATIMATSGAVRIFSARQPLDTIVGMINGAPYIAQPEFMDNATEQWGCYYLLPCSTFGGVPFTSFYKNDNEPVDCSFPIPSSPAAATAIAVSNHGYNKFLTAIGLVFQNWDVNYDFDTLYYIPCEVRYDKLSSKSTYLIPRRGYNNYNTYWLNQQ